MPINLYKIKKIGALFIAGFFPVFMFYLGIVISNFLYALGLMFIGMVIGYLIANAMLKHPFTAMIEGKGILAINLDSTGILRPFIVSVNSPFITAKKKGGWIKDVFDRKTVFMLATPKKAEKGAELKDDGGIKIELSEKDYNQGRFALFHYPVILWNDQLNSIITKDFLGGNEMKAFANHQILYLNRQIEDLTSQIRNFARYVVDQLKPKEGFFSNFKWYWIIIIVGVALILILFLPSILQTLGITFGAAKQATTTAVGGTGGILPFN